MFAFSYLILDEYLSFEGEHSMPKTIIVTDNAGGDIHNPYISKHHVIAKMADNLDLMILTGIIPIQFQGEGQDWKFETIEINFRLPLKNVEAFNIKQCAPFITLNSISNDIEAMNAGWAVDEFSGPGVGENLKGIKVQAKIAVRDSDGWLYRIGYHITLLGKIVDYVGHDPDA